MTETMNLLLLNLPSDEKVCQDFPSFTSAGAFVLHPTSKVCLRSCQNAVRWFCIPPTKAIRWEGTRGVGYGVEVGKGV